jgi:hypothetical protein
MRPVQIIDNPPLHPHVCICCGSSPGSRDHFVDLGIETTLIETDKYDARQINDAVIYFCNECMGNLLSRYIMLLTDHIKSQRTGIKLHEATHNKSAEIMQNEILHLRAQVTKLEAKLLAGSVEEKLAEPTEEPSAAELIGNLFGEKKNDGTTGTNVSTERSDDLSVNGSVPDPKGAAEDSDGDNSAAKSIATSDLFDLRIGNLIVPTSS